MFRKVYLSLCCRHAFVFQITLSLVVDHVSWECSTSSVYNLVFVIDMCKCLSQFKSAYFQTKETKIYYFNVTRNKSSSNGSIPLSCFLSLSFSNTHTDTHIYFHIKCYTLIENWFYTSRMHVQRCYYLLTSFNVKRKSVFLDLLSCIEIYTLKK